MVVEADLLVPGDLLLAFAVGEKAVEQVERLVCLAGRCVRPIIAGAVLEDLAGGDDPGPLLVRDLEVWVGRIVLEPDIVPGPMRLISSFSRISASVGGIGPDHLEIGDLADHLARFGSCRIWLWK